MSDVFDEIEKEINNMNVEIHDIKKKYQVRAKSILKEIFDKFFKEVPEISIIEWNQYTPYFNDGDACEFSVNPPSFYIDQDDKDSCEDPYEYNPFSRPSDWYFTEYEKNPNSYYANYVNSYNNIVEKYGEDKVIEINNMINKMENLIMNIDDEVLLDMFGDHVTVTATKDGFEIEEYYHD